uniref:Phosphatidylinositol-4-phosphate 3-kinase, catalytic subunit type 2 beta n=1 Tax=Cyprinus carpio TaxID=7962 RepID=A0A8C2ANY5_CYPCA
MSAAQTQNDREQRWGCLESLGLSQRELVLAEALQMEYDALARHRQDKGPANTLPPETSKSSPAKSEPSMPRRVPSPPRNNLQQGVSGSDPMLNHVQPGVSNLSRSSGESHGFSKEPRYILDELESDLKGTAQLLSKGLPSLDEPPPPVPPRNPIPQNDPFIVHRSSTPRDVNLFTPEVDQPKLYFGDTLNYDNLNDSLSKLNGDWLSPNRSRRVHGDKSGKAVARSNTLPPQIPPRTYFPAQKSTRSQRPFTPIYLLICFPVFTRLRSAYPCNDYSKNAGFVWSPCVAQDELQQGLGVSIKVTVYSDHFREPLTFSCDGLSTIDLLIYQTLCYAHDDLDMIDVDDYLMKICGQHYFKNMFQIGFIPILILSFSKYRVCFPIQFNQLPRESQLTVTLYATPVSPPGGAEEKSKQKRTIEALALICLFFFNCWQTFSFCAFLSLMIMPCVGSFSTKLSWYFQVDFPTSSFEVRFSTPAPAEFSPQYEFSRLDQLSQRQLHDVLHKKSLFWLTPEDRRLLWEKRYFCHVEASRLPLVLASAPSWEWACLPDIYALLRQWGCMNHLDTLGLLNATFPDQECRRTAVQWMDSISDPELLDFLPQLVQALKYECYLDSHLVRFLLRRAIGDVRIAHYLFWLLKDTLQDSQFSVRYQYLLAALLCCSGRGLRDEFDSQCWLVNILAKVAQRVRDSSPSSRQEVKQFFSINSTCRLPLNPGLLVKGINIQSCSYFNSNAVPLKLSFQNQDPLGDNINVIFKSGDDLRQDMLTLQIIRIMNKIWIQEGLDMRMVIFRCFSTGRGRGMVEMIPNAETLRKIQVEHGVTGSFKDRPLADWLQKHNPTEDEYEKAVENFIYSCAGCCVATYILGICDRHNDNIMLKTSGHMFHIDFGKFLGHAQMFGNIKRDRAPFVFTSDMAYVINGGDKPSSRFHDFVDLCCEAYNLIRKHAHLFLNLLGLMLSSGIPELSDVDDLKYVYDALRPHESEADATMHFTRLIESSLGSVATKLNFFIHNLAQMKFASSEERPVLSFAPRVYTLKSDGVIRSLFVWRHIKTYTPSKGYSYVVKVEREGQQGSTLVQRTFEEFHELHSKLQLIFPSSKLPSFPSRFVIGRSRGEGLADRRKEELNGYVWHLIHAAQDVAQVTFDTHTLVHTKSSSSSSDVSWAPVPGTVAGEVKLSILYKSDKLFIMVMHIRGLVSDGTDPDPYVKLYLLPDPQKTSKRKTKAARRTCNPTYNEMLVYNKIPRGDLQQRTIHLRVLSEGAFWENTLLGETIIQLKDLTPGHRWVGWHQLGARGSDINR